MKIRFIVLISVFGLSLSFCWAQEGPNAGASQSVFQAGAGLVIVDKPQKGGDTEILPIPTVYFQKDRFILFGPQAQWVFYYDERLTVSALGQLRYEGYDDDESRHLRGMSDRRASVEAGLLAAQDFDWGRLAAQWTSDILNEHKGHEIRLTASRRFADAAGVDKLAVTPTVGLNWRSKQLNDYYYGVERKEATAWRPAYNAGDSVGLLTSLRVDYPLNERWNLFGVVSAEWLGSEITDSPIVDQDYRMSVLIGTLYRF